MLELNYFKKVIEIANDLIWYAKSESANDVEEAAKRLNQLEKKIEKEGLK